MGKTTNERMGRRSSSVIAKEKYDAVINNPNRNDNSGQKDRYMTTRDPTASGGNNITNRVDRKNSQGQEGMRFRNIMRNIWGPPAY